MNRIRHTCLSWLLTLSLLAGLVSSSLTGCTARPFEDPSDSFAESRTESTLSGTVSPDGSDTEEVSPSPDESDTEEVPPSQDESDTEEIPPSPDESDTEEVSPSPDESDTEEVPPSPDESDTSPETDEPQGPVTDPYVNMSEEEFYRHYTPATTAADARFRSQHHFLSGTLAEQDQKPTMSACRPTAGNRLVRNDTALYRENGDTYLIVDAHGQVVGQVCRGGAYITLEEVAAYVLAFGDVPANYVEGKNMKPSRSPWGAYLRLNHSPFSGDTSRYPFEPVLPRISGCGGDLYYYEIDIGTTGTDCDPHYHTAPYNTGSRITRGAARLVYTRYDANHDEIIDINEKFVFYTYNHYNDFQEYLNYAGGWGDMFGNITGGGKLSDKHQYNPTPYIPTVLGSLTADSVCAAWDDSGRVTVRTAMPVCLPRAVYLSADFRPLAERPFRRAA